MEIKVKFHPHWDDYFQEKELGILIPAYTGSPGNASPWPSPISRRPRSWRLSLVYFVCLILTMNCAALIFQDSRPGSFNNIKRNVVRFLPFISHVVAPPSVAFALQRAADREASLLVPGEPIPDSVLESSLASWICSKDGSEWSQRARSARQSLLDSKQLRQRSVKEAGSEARICEADWGNDSPDLRSIAHIGYDPASKAVEKSKIVGVQNADSANDGDLVTLVTQVPISRLHVLEDQCTLWAGLPLAASIYIPVVNGRPANFSGLDAAVAEVLRVAKNIENAGPETSCRLSAEVLVENLCSSDRGEPTNALRNRALRLVSTKAVFLSDGMHLGVLIPALSPINTWYGRIGRQLAMELASSAYRGGIIKQVRTNQMKGPLGWGLENDEKLMTAEFSKWAAQQYTLNTTTLGDGAAPLALMLTVKVPWFDERLRGAAYSQALFVRHAEYLARNTTWSTLGGVWAVRLAPFDHVVGDQGGDEQERANIALFLRHKEAAMKGKYVPAVGLQELCYI
ncbi:hypothetical protein Ndes2526B_g02066 [Nannochloris sp. 'desiccata']